MTRSRPPPGHNHRQHRGGATSRRSPTNRENVPPHRQQWRSNTSNTQPPTEWHTWPEFTVYLDNLPTNVTTVNLWDWFSNEGDIVYMDIFERGSQGSMSGKIRFEPPPKRDFWSTGKYSVTHPDGHKYPNGLSIHVKASGEVPDGWVRSPVCPDRHHPIKITLHPLALQFGSLVGLKKMKVMKSFCVPVADESLKVELNLKMKFLTAFFQTEVVTQHGHSKVREHKLVIDFSRMKEVHQTACEDDNIAIVVPLKFAPRYYWKQDDMTSVFSDAAKSWGASEAWCRATDILKDVESRMEHPVALHTEYNDPGFIDLGRWTTIRFVLGGKSKEAAVLNRQLISALEDFNIISQVRDDFKAVIGKAPEIWGHLEHPKMLEEGNALHLLGLSTAPATQVSFEVRYQLEVCISRRILNEHHISVEFLRELASMDPSRARLLLEYLADQNELVQNPMSVFENPDAKSYFPHVRVPHYCALMRKAVITPTTIRFNTPTVEMSNRVLRRYSHMHDRFLRVQFMDEAENSRIRINKDRNDEIWKRLSRTLYQGIKIGDRVYEFLAFGSSQLKQCGAYFFCPTHHTSCDDIRKWMGQFSHIKIIAKYAARLGQCLSTTREVRGISVPSIRPIEDIERNGHCFTDGVGKISPFIAQMIVEDIGLDVFDQPSAFQFRMGGCKGVLALWPDAKGTEVHVRESQEKFKAEFNGLEINRCAKFATATLNRQTITILEALGVPTSSFVDLLNHQLHIYELAMEDNKTAVEILRTFVDENQTTLAIAELLEADFKTEQAHEPFVVNILNLWRTWSLKLLKEKARIHVENSAFVLGCVDETKTLRGHSWTTEDSKDKDVNKLPQIFLQLTNSKDYNKTRVIKGVCLVGRNPSLHPGDIRIVEAVDEPKLHHLKDVVVFPATGDRPVPSMLSGGDLDGDDFFIIWDSSLMPKTWNYPPMDYTGPKPQQLDRDVNVDDLRDFFVKYMQNDELPLIAVSHLATADNFGLMSQKCLELAALHSKAVDYPKTGEPATMRRDQQVRKWPHFMEKKNIYHSKKALGVIYDRVVNKSIQFNPIWDSPFDQRIAEHDTVKPDNDMLNAAKKIKRDYDTSVRRILNQHDVKTEFELWTGFAMSKPPVGSDYKRQEELGREYGVLKQRFRDICYEAAGGKHAEAVDRFVAAMYLVTEEEIKLALCETMDDADCVSQSGQAEAKAMPLISFPWIFHWVMIRLVSSGKMSKGPTQVATDGKPSQHLEQPPIDKQSESAKASHKASVVETARIDLGADYTHLPDGTVIHRGEPLTLFDFSETAPSESPVLEPGEEKAFRSQEVQQGDQHGPSSNGNGDKDQVLTEAEEKGRETEAQKESAMGRLARLIDCEGE
ncbi:RNA-dependent RNA polymerase 1 [Neonectria ditissima]|uniref:RNA-dependent RNA polymerase n=1 Tax=Neonectria ditissima TaxID=78410 RepID=A0A0P7B1Z1_9HYPO|nr:RNA-dependent RNA polymerase 1 [Neonectria ditissima]